MVCIHDNMDFPTHPPHLPRKLPGRDNPLSRPGLGDCNPRSTRLLWPPVQEYRRFDGMLDDEDFLDLMETAAGLFVEPVVDTTKVRMN